MTDNATTDDDGTAPTDGAEEQLAPERDGQATTVEEAMDAATDEEGYVDESAYTTPAGSTTIGDAT
jgi:hypothetical protein